MRIGVLTGCLPVEIVQNLTWNGSGPFAIVRPQRAISPASSNTDFTFTDGLYAHSTSALVQNRLCAAATVSECLHKPSKADALALVGTRSDG